MDPHLPKNPFLGFTELHSRNPDYKHLVSRRESGSKAGEEILCRERGIFFSLVPVVVSVRTEEQSRLNPEHCAAGIRPGTAL